MRGFLPGFVIVAALLAACSSAPVPRGQATRPQVSAESHPRPGGAPTAGSVRPAVPTPPPSWTSDVESSRGFTLQYPPGWAPKAAATGGPDHVYYAPADAPAPLEMSQGDVWLTVQIEQGGGSCHPKLPGDDGGSVPAVLAGRQTKLELRDPPAGLSEPTWKAYAVTRAGSRCYVLWFVTLNRQTRARELPVMLQILAGFSDGSVVQPSPSPVPSASPEPAQSPIPGPSPT